MCNWLSFLDEPLPLLKSMFVIMPATHVKYSSLHTGCFHVYLSALSLLVYNLFMGMFQCNSRATQYCLCTGAFCTELMWEEVVSPMMNCLRTDPIISRPMSGSGRKRHKVLVLNPVSAANLTLLIGSVVACEHSGPSCLPSKYTVLNWIITVILYCCYIDIVRFAVCGKKDGVRIKFSVIVTFF